MAVRSGDDLKNAFGVDRLGPSRVYNPPLTHRLDKGREIVGAVERQENIGIEIKKDDRNLSTPVTYPTIFELNLPGSGEHPSDSLYIAQPASKVSVLCDCFERFLLCNDCDEPGIVSLPFTVSLNQHFYETPIRVEKEVLEIEDDRD